MCFLQAAIFLTVLTGIVTVANGVPVSDRDHATPFLKFVTGTSGSDRVSINFDSPCDGCFIGTDAALKLTLDVDRAEDECTGSGVRLNGVDLANSNDRGLFDFGALASNGISDHEYTAEWYLTCLDYQVSLLNVQFSQKDDPAHSIVGGFSTSFQQTYHPWILKLDPTLSTSGQEEIDNAAWAYPGPEESLRIGLPPGDPPPPPPPGPVPVPLPADLVLPEGLREQMEKLWKLKFEKQKLNTEIQEVASDVVSIWKAEFAECNSLTCYVRTAFKNVPIIFRLIIHGLKHEASVPHVINSTEDQVPLDSETDQLQHDATTDSSAPLITPAPKLSSDLPLSKLVSRTISSSPSSSPLPPSNPDVPSQPDAPSQPEAPSPPGAPSQPEAPSEPAQPDHPHPPFDANGLPPWGAGPPPWAKPGDRPPWGTGPPPWAKPGDHRPPWGAGPPPWAKPGDHRPWGDGQPPWERPHPQGPEAEPAEPAEPRSFSLGSWFKGVLEDQEHLRVHVMAALVSFGVVAVIALGILVCVKHRNYIWRNPRMRAECMARREEWKRRKAYRKAACKYQVRTFFASLVWWKKAEGSDAEKEEFLRNKARNEGSAFGQEIDGLRLASEIVGELVRAEDARGHNAGGSDAGERSSISETLPTYSEPPGYNSAAEGDISVIDGFTGYTPSGTDESAESSVLDCSPRMSFDTQSVCMTRYSGDSRD